MNRVIVAFILIFSLTEALYCQELHLLGGINSSTFKVNINYPGDPRYFRMFNAPMTNQSISAGVEFEGNDLFSVPIYVHYNKLGATFYDDEFKEIMMRDFNSEEKFEISTLSLNPMLKIRPISLEGLEFYALMGVKLDYNFPANKFSRDTSTMKLYEENASNMTLASNMGLGIKYNISEKLGIMVQSTYNFPITKIIYADQSVHQNSAGVYVPAWFYEVSYTYFQFQAGISYNINLLKSN